MKEKRVRIVDIGVGDAFYNKKGALIGIIGVFRKDHMSHRKPTYYEGRFTPDPINLHIFEKALSHMEEGAIYFAELKVEKVEEE